MAQFHTQRNELGANSFIIAGDHGTAVVDPGWYPSEIAALQRCVATTPAGRATHVILTHGHPDHVAGWAAFPGATLIADPKILTANDWAKARALIEGQYVRAGISSAPKFGPPPSAAITRPPELLDLGGVSLRFVAAPLHSDDSLLVLVPELKLIIGGDFLTGEQGWPPVVRTTLAEYLAATGEVAALCDEYGIEQWFPGHGPAFRTRRELRERLAIDHDYLTRLFAAVFAARTAGYSQAEVEHRMAVFHLGNERLSGNALRAHLGNIRALYAC